jgi:hypothetical protein
VLRALHEAGIRVDLVAGQGMGAVSAMFAVVDGAARLWEPRGPWRSGQAARLYRWRPSLRIAAWALWLGLGVLAIPVLFLGGALLTYAGSLLLRVLGVQAGAVWAAGYERLLDSLFAPAGLPVMLPRLVFAAMIVLLCSALAGALRETWRARGGRRGRGPFWWRLFAAPLSAQEPIRLFGGRLWRLIRGATAPAHHQSDEFSRAFTELLVENLGQPGFRELIVTAHDLDTRSDLVFVLLGEPYRLRYFGGQTGLHADRAQANVLDLAGAGRSHAFDALAAALCLPVGTEPHLVRFASDGYWRGEAHRTCDRPGSVTRLLEEVARAGAEQVIVVAASPPIAGPHALSAGRLDARSRAGEYLAGMEAAAVRDAVAAHGPAFGSVFQIRPAHNPLGPFDFSGGYDDRSDRIHTLAELVSRGYEDAHRQFIDPIVGAGGDRFEDASAP